MKLSKEEQNTSPTLLEVRKSYFDRLCLDLDGKIYGSGVFKGSFSEWREDLPMLQKLEILWTSNLMSLLFHRDDLLQILSSLAEPCHHFED